MFKLIVSSFLLIGTTLFSGELIVNQAFTPSNMQKTQATGWKVVKNGVKAGSIPCVFTDNVAKMKLVSGEKGITLIQNPPLNAGSAYIISFEAKSPAAIKLACYWEWIFADGKWGNSGTTYMNVGKDWKKFSFRFTPPAGKKAYKARPYLAIGIRQAGECFLRNVSVKPAAEQLIMNAEFTPSNAAKTAAEGWVVKPYGTKGGTFDNNTAKLTLSADGKNIYLVQGNIPFVQGESYKITFETRGTPQLEMHCYLEWIFANGKWGNSGTRAVKCSDKWQVGTVNFTMPGPGAEFKASPYLAFTIDKKGFCEIRNVSVIPLKKKTAQITDGGFDNPVRNPWKLVKNSSIDKTGGRTSPGVLSLNGPGAAASLELLLKAGKNYKITYYVRGMENKKSSNGFSEYKAVMQLTPGNQLYGNEVQDCFQRTWQNRDVKIYVPKGANSTLTINLSSLSDGKIQFDDFAISEIAAEKKHVFNVLLKSPWYRNSFFASLPETEVRGTVSFPSQIVSCDVVFQGEKLSFRNTGKPVEFRFPASNLKVGKYEIIFTGKNQNRTSVTEKIIIEKLPPVKNEVVIGKDRKIYHNGKPIYFMDFGSGRFPDVLWSYGFYDEADYYLRRTGMGCMIPTSADGIRAILDECQKKGGKAICRIDTDGSWSRLKDEAKFNKYWQGELEKIATFKDHPALVGYYAYDEPLWNGFPLEKMKYTYESLKKLDPYHPVFLCEAPRGLPADWKPYAQYCDVFGIDIYPVPAGVHSGIAEKGLRSVGEYTKMSMEAMADHGTVWTILQGFSWGNSKKDKRATLRYPTYEEFRFMLYDAVLHGAKALDFYVYENYDPAFEQKMYKALCGFNHIHDILLNGELVRFKYPASEKIITATYKYKGNYYIIVLNRAESSGTIDLRKIGKKLYLHNGEEVTVPASMYVRIPAYTAHVYSTSAKLPDVPGVQHIPAMEKRLPAYFRTLTNMVNGLETKAFWIWTNAKSDLCCASRQVDVRKKIAKAVMRITADDIFTLYLNGKVIQTGGFWMQYKEVDLQPYLKPGKNILCVYAVNQVGPCGLLADLEIEYTDGSREHILTDKTWRTRPEVPAYEWLKTGLTDGQPAKEQFPFGQGPWKR